MPPRQAAAAGDLRAHVCIALAGSAIGELSHAPRGEPIVLDNTQVVLPAGSFDVAIRSGVGPWPNYSSARLMAEQRTPMFSPKWAPARLTPKKLLELPLIPDPEWSAWFKLAGIPNAKPTFVATRYSNYELEAQAAPQGIGAALLSPVLFADLVAQGVLMAPFSWTIEGRACYWLLWTDESPDCHFVRWVKAQFGIGRSRLPHNERSRPRMWVLGPIETGEGRRYRTGT